MPAMTEVRETTRRLGIRASSVMSSSVMPSAKYSWEGSPERLSRGRTARERMGAEWTRVARSQAMTRKANPATRMAARRKSERGLGEVCGCGLGAGVSDGMLVGSAVTDAVSTYAMKR